MATKHSWQSVVLGINNEYRRHENEMRFES